METEIYSRLALCNRSCCRNRSGISEGRENEAYNIGGFNEWKNIDLVKLLCQQMDQKLGREVGESRKIDHLRKRSPRPRFALCDRCHKNK